MEHLMDAYLNRQEPDINDIAYHWEPDDPWFAGEADDHICWLIDTDQVPDLNEEAPETGTLEGFRTQTVAA